MSMLLIPDISHYSQVSSFHDLKAAGVPAVICKASQGTGNVDAKYHDFYSRAKSAGLIVGAYHYLEPGDVPGQMAHFLATARLVKGDLRPIIDAEAPGLGRADTAAALEILAAKALRPILYCSSSWYADVMGSPTDHALWIAAYRGTRPALPKGAVWFGWQFSDHQSFPGIDNPCDASRFYGTVEELKGFCL